MPTKNIQFDSRFADMVRRGQKITTIRSAAVAPGDLLMLEEASGSEVVPLGRAEVLFCVPITLGVQQNGMPRVKLGSCWQNIAEMTLLAEGDGFDDPREMINWFIRRYGLGVHVGNGCREIYQGFFITWCLEP